MINPTLESESGRAHYLRVYREGLLRDTLPFWFPRCVDEEHGGYLHCRDGDGSLIDSDKSVWAQGRMAWMLLELWNTIEKRPEWLNWAQSGLDFLARHGFDSDGRMFFHLARDGSPLRKRRYAYSESFAAIAWAAHAKATGDDQSASRAAKLFDHFTRWNFTPGLMPSKDTGNRPAIGLGPRMITIVTAQELRANLGESKLWTSWIDRCIDEIDRLFVKHDLRAVMETVAPDGSIINHFDGRLLNPGHAIEGAWFILREAEHRGDKPMAQFGCLMVDYAWERGWDHQHGGLFYFRDIEGKPVSEYWHDMKFWWPHNEAVIATLMAWEATGNSKYASWHAMVHEWSHRHFADPAHGEWFGYLHRDGRLSNTIKGNLWKSCFHHPRMQYWCWRRLAASLGITLSPESPLG